MPSETATETATLPSGRARWRTLLIVLMCAAWTPLAIEGYLRIFKPQAIVPRHVTATSYGIRGNRPSMTYVQKSPEYLAEIRINAAGIRADREFDVGKPAGMRRIVVLGDSYGMGYEANLEDTFLARLEERLTQGGERVEVINLSVSGHGNAEELITLREAGLKYSPDVVLLCWHTTDFDDNVRSGLFALRDGDVERRSSTYLPAIATRERLDRIWLYRVLEAHSHAYAWVREKAASEIKKVLVNVRGRESPSAEHAARSERAARDLTVALVKEIAREAKSAGAEFVLLDIPVFSSKGEFLSRLPDELAGPDVVSPIPAFQANAKAHLYFDKWHRHFTPRANRLVGDELAARIQRIWQGRTP